MSRAPIPKQQKGEGSFYGIFNKTINEIPEPKWRELIEEQDYDTLIIDIREELLAQVTDECYQKHLKKQVYKFLIECTHKAFQQLVPLHFYTYDDSHKFSSSQGSWIPDEEPIVCKPDSWAKGNIPYNMDDIPKHKAQQTDTVSSDYHIVKCDEYPSNYRFDWLSNKYEMEEDEDAEYASPFDDIVPEADEPELAAFQSNVQFSNFELNLSSEMIPSLQDISIQPNRVASENTFYRIMKVNRTSSISLQASTKAKKSNPPPAWTTIDEIRDEVKTHTFGPNRYNPPVFISNQMPDDF